MVFRIGVYTVSLVDLECGVETFGTGCHALKAFGLRSLTDSFLGLSKTRKCGRESGDTGLSVSFGGNVCFMPARHVASFSCVPFVWHPEWISDMMLLLAT